MYSTLRAGRIALSILLLIFLSSCMEVPPEPLRLGTNVWPGYEPLHLAHELNYFGDHPIHLVEHSAATEVIRAMRNGAIDAAALTLDETLLLTQHGHRLWILLVTDFSHGGDAVIAHPDLRNLSGLRGKKIGVEDSALGAFMLHRALEQVGLKHVDIEPVPLSVDKHERAFLEKNIDAVVTFEPVRSKLLKQGGIELFDSSKIPGEIVDVLVVREAYARQHPDVVKALRDGWFMALDFIQHERQKSAAIMAPREGLDAQEFLEAVDLLKIPSREENQALLGGRTPGLLASAQRLQDVMLEHNLQDQPVVLQDLLGFHHYAEQK